MKHVNIYQAKTSLSALVELAANGEEIVIAKNGKARARLMPMPAEAQRREPKFGTGAHLGWKLPDDFDAWTPELEAMFYPKANPVGEA